ncbi:MAG: hypothetical protein JSU91_02900 [Thermoplasmatales archaeon]|nr:MAG: hypothetical protein JSU91_02900 [Thermoplasmatales archaeon]
MYKKIIGFLIVALLITTSISATGTINFKTLRNVVINNGLEPSPINHVDSNGNIAIKIVAKVTDVYDPYNLLGGAILVGDKISGKYIYDSGTVDTFGGDPSRGFYEHFSPPYGIELEVGGFVFETNPNDVDFLIAILDDDHYYYNGDLYAVVSYNNMQLSNGIQIYIIYWFLIDHTYSVLSNDALPTTAPVLSDWGENELGITGYDPSYPYHQFDIKATVTKATLSRSQERDVYFNMQPIFIWLFERFPNAFPLIRQLLGL